MDFDSPDVAKEFPGLYASESMKRSQSRECDDSDEEKTFRKDLLGKKKDKKESKKDKGYVAFEGESSGDDGDEVKSPDKKKKKSSFLLSRKDTKEKSNKSKDKEVKEDKEEKRKLSKKDSIKKEIKEGEKIKEKKKKESKLLKKKDKKKKTESEIKEEPIFGVPLQVAVERNKSHDDIALPVIVRECIDYIEDHGLSCEGIYRTSGVKSKVSTLKSQYNKREKVYLYEHEPHIVASLLKKFLRDLPEPILTPSLTPKFEEAAALKNEVKKVEIFKKLLNELPNCNHLLLSWILTHMRHVIRREKFNKMNLQNVFIVLSPTLQISHNILQAFFTHYDEFFKGTELKKYVPPMDLASSRLSLELPDSPSAIAEELSRQESVLNVLHAELNTGLRDPQKEEQLWEIQRVVTQLKRKLRFFRQIQDTKGPEEHKPSTKPQTIPKIAAFPSPLKTATPKSPQAKTEEQLPTKVVTSIEQKSPSDGPVKLTVGDRKPSDTMVTTQGSGDQKSSADVSVPAKITSGDQKSVSVPVQVTSGDQKSVSVPVQVISGDQKSMSVPVQGTSGDLKSVSVPAQLASGDQKSVSVPAQLASGDQKSVSVPLTSGDKKSSSDVPVPDQGSSGGQSQRNITVQVVSGEQKSEVNEMRCSEKNEPEKPVVITEKENFISSDLSSKPSIVKIDPKDSNVPPASKVEEEDLTDLIREERMLRLQTEELALLGDELRRKINSEKQEVERLKMDIHEYQQLYKYKRYSFDSSENSSSDSDDSSASDEEEDLSKILADLMIKNKLLEEKNRDVSKAIQEEREACLNIKVQMKMLYSV